VQNVSAVLEGRRLAVCVQYSIVGAGVLQMWIVGTLFVGPMEMLRDALAAGVSICILFGS